MLFLEWATLKLCGNTLIKINYKKHAADYFAACFIV